MDLLTLSAVFNVLFFLQKALQGSHPTEFSGMKPHEYPSFPISIDSWHRIDAVQGQ